MMMMMMMMMMMIFFFFFADDEATSLGKQNTISQDEGVEPYTNNSLNESNAKIVFP